MDNNTVDQIATALTDATSQRRHWAFTTASSFICSPSLSQRIDDADAVLAWFEPLSQEASDRLTAVFHYLGYQPFRSVAEFRAAAEKLVAWLDGGVSAP